MRRFSFKIDLKKTGGKSVPKREAGRSSVPEGVADGFEMSSDLSERRQGMSDWPEFQRLLERLPALVGSVGEWEDRHLAAEYVRIYEVTRKKVLEAVPGFDQTDNLETHCFFHPDGTKHVVSRLLSRPNERINEIRLTQSGQLIRLYYECRGDDLQDLEDLFSTGLLGLEDDETRFRMFPHYVLRFFLLNPEGDQLASTFRGAFYYDHERQEVVLEEAESL